jgi:hypothetical protein
MDYDVFRLRRLPPPLDDSVGKQGQYSNRWGACLWAAGRRMRLPTKRKVLRWNWNGLLTKLWLLAADEDDLGLGCGCCCDKLGLLPSTNKVASSRMGLNMIFGGPSSSSSLQLKLPVKFRSSSTSMIFNGRGRRFLERGQPVMLQRLFRRRLLPPALRQALRRESQVPVLVLVLPISDAVS